MALGLLGSAFVGGSLLSAYSVYAQYKAAQQQAEFQAGIASQNAKLAKRKEKEIEGQSVKTAKRLEQQTVNVIADQITIYSASGVDTTSATVKEIINDTARTGAADVAQSMDNFAKEAWSADVESKIEETKADVLTAQARQSGRLAPIAAVSSLLSSAGQFGLSEFARST